MDLTFGDEQAMLAATAESFVARECPPERVRRIEAAPDWWDAALWDAIRGLGWCALALPERWGGAGAGLLEAAIVAEQLGRGAVPSPLLASTVAALAIAWAGDEARHGGLVRELAEGARVGTLAVVEPPMNDVWAAPRMAGGPELSGEKLVVPWAAVADVVVVVTAQGPYLVEARARGVRVEPHDAYAGDPLYRLTLERAPAEPVGDGSSPVRPAITARVLDTSAVLQLAAAVGAAETCVDLAVRHASERVQFGRPIGSFQAVAHRCVDMRAEVDACRYLAYQAAWSLDSGGDATEAVSCALAYAAGASRRVFLDAHQVLGAIGFSTEHPLHLFTRRLEAFVVAHAAGDFHRDRLAGAIGLA